jgi:hypothetical protein
MATNKRIGVRPRIGEFYFRLSCKLLEAAKAGFDWIVFDLSTLPFEENVRETKAAVETLKARVRTFLWKARLATSAAARKSTVPRQTCRKDSRARPRPNSSWKRPESTHWPLRSATCMDCSRAWSPAIVRSDWILSGSAQLRQRSGSS